MSTKPTDTAQTFDDVKEAAWQEALTRSLQIYNAFCAGMGEQLGEEGEARLFFDAGYRAALSSLSADTRCEMCGYEQGKPLPNVEGTCPSCYRTYKTLDCSAADHPVTEPLCNESHPKRNAVSGRGEALCCNDGRAGRAAYGCSERAVQDRAVRVRGDLRRRARADS